MNTPTFPLSPSVSTHGRMKLGLQDCLDYSLAGIRLDPSRRILLDSAIF